MGAGAIVMMLVVIAGFFGFQMFGRAKLAAWQAERSPPPGRKRDEEAFAMLDGAHRAALVALERDDVAPAVAALAALREGAWNERATLLRYFRATITRGPLDAAIATSPNEPILHLLRAVQSMEWAWEARGGGGASGVSAEGWRKFEERMGLAEQDLNRAAELDPADPTPHALLVEVARHVKRGEARARAHLDAAIVRNPADVAARNNFFTFFCLRRYEGSFEKMQSFVREHVAGAPAGDLRHAFVFRMHHEMWSYEHAFGDPATGDAYAARPDVRAEVAESYARSVGAPEHRRNFASLARINDFAAWFFLVQDRERCRDALSKLGDEQYAKHPWSELGPPSKQFDVARAWATKGGPHQILGWR
jgi:hypothetical protein